jgi:putative membrane protein
VVRAVRRPDGDPAPPRSPEQVLAERYARGEIDEEDLRRRLDTLRRTGGGSS